MRFVYTLTGYYQKFVGLSADTKPTDPRLWEGSRLLEADTGKVYIYVQGDWYYIPELEF